MEERQVNQDGRRWGHVRPSDLTHASTTQPRLLDPRRDARRGEDTRRVFASRTSRAMAAILLSALLASVGTTAAVAAPVATGLDAPIHAFDWPTSAPNDTYFGAQTDLTPIGVPAAWLRSTGNPAVVVAVLDTGIDASHPEFRGRVVPGFNALTGQPDGLGDFGPTNDDNDHGTHVSGTVAAMANNGAGIAGIAPNVSIMPIKVLGANGSGDFGGMVTGMNWAVGHGARIITMSLGGILAPSQAASLQPTFDATYAAGVVVVAASGNDGAVLDEYPCNFIHVICVGSTTNDGSAVSTFSTRTAALALVAPGEHIASAIPGNHYGYGTGTSMATPHVTGAVALMRSIDPQISVDQVMADLTQTARPLATGGRNPDSGYGLLQVSAALDLVSGGAPLATPSPTPAPGTGPSPTPDPNASSTPVADPNASPSPIPDLNVSPSPAPSATPPPLVPALTGSTPRNGSRNVLRSTRPHLTFSVPMTGISTRTITMIDLSLGRRVTFRISYSATSRVATVTPTVRLASNHSYRIIVSGITSASGGLPLSRTFAVTFRTGSR
jgi:serine protease